MKLRSGRQSTHGVLELSIKEVFFLGKKHKKMENWWQLNGFCQSLWTFLIETWKFSREFHGCLAFNSWKFENKTGYVLQSEKWQIKSNTWFSMDSFTGMWHEGFNRNWSFPILGNKSIWSMQKYQVFFQRHGNTTIKYRDMSQPSTSTSSGPTPIWVCHWVMGKMMIIR